MPQDIKITATVGRINIVRQCTNLIEDQGKVMYLLNSIDFRNGGEFTVRDAGSGALLPRGKTFAMAEPGLCKQDLFESILHFQRHHVKRIRTVDGNISPTGPTLRLMNELANPSLGVEIPKPEIFHSSYRATIFDISVGIRTSARIIFSPLADNTNPKQILEYRFDGLGFISPGFVPNFHSHVVPVPGKHNDRAFEGSASFKLIHAGGPLGGGICELTVPVAFEDGSTLQRSFVATRIGRGAILLTGGLSSGTMKFVASGNTIIRPDLR